MVHETHLRQCVFWCCWLGYCRPMAMAQTAESGRWVLCCALAAQSDRWALCCALTAQSDR